MANRTQGVPNEKLQSWADCFTQSNCSPGLLVGLWKDGKEVAYTESTSPAVTAARGKAYTRDTLFRIYSMTKPVTAVCVLIAAQRGLLSLDDPVKKFLPKFGDLQVVSSTNADGTVNTTEPQAVDMTVRHLLTNTSGLGYGLFQTGPWDAAIQAAAGPACVAALFNDGTMDSQQLCDAMTSAGCCLAFQPGTRFLYSLSFDVLGRILEIVHGATLDAVFHKDIFQPLGMNSTSFYISDADCESKLVDLYEVHPNGGFDIIKSSNVLRDERRASARPAGRRLLSGGAGLVSTLDDFSKFAHALLHAATNKQVPGACIPDLTPAAVQIMASHQLPATLDGKPTDFEHLNINPAMFSETAGQGMGYGHGVSVVLDPTKAKGAALSSVGEFGWGGMASTWFFVSPGQNAVCVMMSQLVPSSKLPVRTQLRWLAHSILRQAAAAPVAPVAPVAPAGFGFGFAPAAAAAAASVPASTGAGFGFGARAAAAPAPAASGGFTFAPAAGAPASTGFGFAAMEAALPLPQVPGRPIPAAAKLSKDLHLENEDIEEVKEEIATAACAWREVQADATSRGSKAAQIPKLFKAVKYFSFQQEDCDKLGAIATWDELGFTEWYLRFIFGEDEGEDDPDYRSEGEEGEDGGGGDDGRRAAADSSASAGAGASAGSANVIKGSWSDVKWAQKPADVAVDGVSWRCDTCFIVTPAASELCSGCGGRRK